MENKIILKKSHLDRKDVNKTSGQSYNAPTIVVYDSRVVFDLKLPHITTLES